MRLVRKMAVIENGEMTAVDEELGSKNDVGAGS
jgi:hypothetical protein